MPLSPDSAPWAGLWGIIQAGVAVRAYLPSTKWVRRGQSTNSPISTRKA